jgi:NAD(P)-dependent dehydrogenase (short-subunit alcohol dehydrogenase family)
MKYRAKPEDGVAWVTGASAGIGRGVALELARRGFVVHVTARRADELLTLAGEANGFPGQVVPMPGDVTDRPGMARLIAEIESARPIALAVFNAWGSFADASDDFGGDGFARTFDLNVQGVANGVNPVFNAMRARKRGQIAIVGSVAGYGGLPNAGAYAPSKAAVISLAVGLKFRADRDNVTVQIVNPGYVRTALTANNDYPRPFMLECDNACRRLCDGLARGGFEVRFPRRLAWGTRLVQSLPYPLFFWLFNKARMRG